MEATRGLKKAVNRLAHSAGLAHAERIKLQLLAEIAQRMADGESTAAITNSLAARNAIEPLKPCR